jgi:hypothetical protein
MDIKNIIDHRSQNVTINFATAGTAEIDVVGEFREPLTNGGQVL